MMYSFRRKRDKAVQSAVLGLAVLAWTLVPGLLSAQVELPKTPAGERAGQLIDLLNGKIALPSKEFVRRNCSEGFKSGIPENSWGGVLDQVKAMASPVELASIEKSEPGEIVVVIRSVARGIGFSISLSVESKSPHLIAMMRFMPAGQSGNPSPRTPSGDAGAASWSPAEIKAYLDEQAAQGRFSGTAMVARNGKPLLVQSAGLASKRFRAPNTPETKFNLGSLNKSFTAVAVLQLVEEGKIGIDDPIGKYLDGFPPDIAAKVKIRHLLAMSSGWGDYWGHPDYLQHKDEMRTVAQYMEFIKGLPLDFEPGARSQHSNIGYEVAGAVIEKVSGLDYFDYIRARIYKPAGMADSDSFDRDGPVENLATGYTDHNPADKTGSGFGWENTYILSPRGTPAGGGYSTAGDMLKYDSALREGRLVGKAYLDFMINGFNGRIGDPPQRTFARGAGGAYGVSTFFGRDLKDGYTIIVLTNVDNPVAIEIGNEIARGLNLK